jgi:hypothetical protein
MNCRHAILLGWLIAVVHVPAVARADHAVVLVARADSPIDTIYPLDIRKVYLGFSLRAYGNESIHAATNEADPALYDVFLQDVIAMSAKSYNRRLLTLTLQSGRRRPAVYHSISALMEALREDPNLITFMWQEDFEKAANLKILRVIWKE